MAKARPSENLTDANIEKVIKWLEEDKPPKTKKDCCGLLGISYNVTRLATLIEKYKEKKAKEAERRAEKRGKPASTEEIQYVIQEYLEGATVDSISKSVYRTAAFVKTVLDKHNVPIRATSHDYFKPELVPEGAIRERFAIGEVVYSVRYDSTARIETEKFDPRYGWIYRIWLLSDKWLQYSYQESCELASLEHLRKLGVRV